MKAKTIRVTRLVEEVNRRNRESVVSREVRMGWNLLLEDILMETGNYSGFGYLYQKDVPPGQLPGISDDPDCWDFPDDSRRRYIPAP